MLDPAGAASYPIFSVNLEQLRLRLYAVGPEHWPAYQQWSRNYRQDESAPPGVLVLDTLIATAERPDAQDIERCARSITGRPDLRVKGWRELKSNDHPTVAYEVDIE